MSGVDLDGSARRQHYNFATSLRQGGQSSPSSLSKTKVSTRRRPAFTAFAFVVAA
jgi:hypothetical protein